MRIVHVMDHSLPGTDGYAIRAKYLLEAQAAAGHQVTVLTSPSQGAEAVEETLNGVTYRRSHFSPAQAAFVRRGAKHLVFGSAIQARLSRLLDESPTDIVHAHTPFTVARPALAEARRRGLPFVYEKRNLWEQSARARGKTSGRWPFFQIAQALDRSVTLKSDAVFTITEALRERTAAHGGDARRIFVVGNGVDTDSFHPVAPSAELRQKCLGDGSFVFGFVGSFFKFEGLPLLIEAFARVHATHPGARLVLVGNGEDFEPVRALVAERGLSQGVWLVGRVAHEQVMDFIAAMDVLVYPRLRSDLTDLISPLKPLEPMAMGRCVLGSDVGGIRELIRDGETGLLFKADSIESLVARMTTLLGGSVDSDALGQRARAHAVAHRQWHQMARAYDAGYQFACATRKLEAVPT
jgi:PEP-CTERM/exosortase A-associated glycosyltransferase